MDAAKVNANFVSAACNFVLISRPQQHSNIYTVVCLKEKQKFPFESPK